MHNTMENELQGIKLYKDGSLMVRKSETARYYTDDFYKKIRKCYFGLFVRLRGFGWCWNQFWLTFPFDRLDLFDIFV